MIKNKLSSTKTSIIYATNFIQYQQIQLVMEGIFQTIGFGQGMRLFVTYRKGKGTHNPLKLSLHYQCTAQTTNCVNVPPQTIKKCQYAPKKKTKMILNFFE